MPNTLSCCFIATFTQRGDERHLPTSGTKMNNLLSLEDIVMACVEGLRLHTVHMLVIGFSSCDVTKSFLSVNIISSIQLE